MSSIQLIMCIIIYRRSLHVYFTTFDMILKFILTDMFVHVHVTLTPLPINPVKQYTEFKVGDMFL